MQHIAPDWSRRIDLPGVGPCPRPVDIDQSVTGFADLVSLRIYSFSPGTPIDGEAEGDEVFIVVLNGACTIAVSGPASAQFDLSDRDGDRAIYLPPHHHYRLNPNTEVDVAYVRARASGTRQVTSFAFEAGASALDVPDYAEFLALKLLRLKAGERLVLGEAGESAPERLVHVQGAEGSTAVLDGGFDRLELQSWDTGALAAGEPGTLQADADALVLLLSARPKS